MVYTPKSFFPHAASRGQAFAHCRLFLIAAFRRNGARVSVLLWLTTLSGQLPVIDLVSRYLTNYLIGRRIIPKRPVTVFTSTYVGDYRILPHLSMSYVLFRGRSLRVTQPSAITRPDCSGQDIRLAYLRHAANIHPEPGSNS